MHLYIKYLAINHVNNLSRHHFKSDIYYIVNSQTTLLHLTYIHLIKLFINFILFFKYLLYMCMCVHEGQIGRWSSDIGIIDNYNLSFGQIGTKPGFFSKNECDLNCSALFLVFIKLTFNSNKTICCNQVYHKSWKTHNSCLWFIYISKKVLK